MSALSSRQPAPACQGLLHCQELKLMINGVDGLRTGLRVELLDVIFELAPHHSIVNSMIYI